MDAVLQRLENLRNEFLVQHTKDGAKVLEVFAQMDTNRSGRISALGFAHAMKKLCGGAAHPLLCEAFFELCDPDGSGTLDYRELHGALKKTMKEAHAARRRKYLTSTRGSRLLRDAQNVEKQQGELRRALDGSPPLRRGSQAELLIRRATATLQVQAPSDEVPPSASSASAGEDAAAPPAPAELPSNPLSPADATRRGPPDAKLRRLFVPAGPNGQRTPLREAAYMRPQSPYLRSIRGALELTPAEGIHVPRDASTRARTLVLSISLPALGAPRPSTCRSTVRPAPTARASTPTQSPLCSSPGGRDAGCRRATPLRRASGVPAQRPARGLARHVPTGAARAGAAAPVARC